VRGLTVFGAALILDRKAGVTAELLDDGAVLWDGEGARLHKLDLVGATVWSLVDGRRTLAEISEALAERFATDPMTVRRDLTGFLQDLVHAGVLVVD
jgi:coenzyme PQQ synthesis protein D (PqqD)